MNCFRTLAIKQTASIQEIKRAYAGKLKQHRPDEDPVAFQEINAAYQSAMESAKQRDAWLQRKADAEQQKQLAIAAGNYSPDDDVEYYDEDEYYFYDEDAAETDSDEAPLPEINDKALTPAAEVEPDSVIAGPDDESQATVPSDSDDNAVASDDYIFRLDDFIEELDNISRQEDDRLLKKWLDDHPDLYSLYLKHQITEPLITAFAQTETPIRPPALEIVIAFFGLDSVSTNHYLIDHQVEMARQKSRLFWHAAAIAYHRRNRKRNLHERWIDQSLRGDANRFQSLYLLFIPGLPSKVMEIANESKDEYGNLNPEFISPPHYQFWSEANDKTRIVSQRFYMALTRSAVLTLIVTLLLGSPTTSAGILGLFAGVFGSWLSIALLRIGNYRLDLYVIRKQTVDKGDILLAIICPIIVITSLFFDSEVISYPAWLLTFLCFSLATTGANKESRPDSYFAFFGGAAFFISMLSFTFVPEILSSSKFILAANLAIGLIVLHDEIYTRIHDCTFEETREKSTWLFWTGITLIILSFGSLAIHFP